MKNLLKILFIASLAFAIGACVEEKPQIEASLVLSSTELVMPSDGGVMKIVYEIRNASSDATVSVVNEADWLDVNTDKPRTIEVTAQKNETGEERSAQLIVSYPGSEDVAVSVKQPSWQAPVTLTVTGTEATSVSFSVTVSDPEFTWVGQVVAKDWFDEKESDEEIFQEDLSYYSLEAQDKEISLSDYLKTIVNKGSYSDLQYKGLDPSSEYVIYVYGITTEGVRTTDIYSAHAVTMPPYDGPVTFDIDVTETDNIMDITVTPDHEGVYYYWNLMDKATYDEWAATYGDDPMEVFQAYVNWDIQDLIDYEYLTTKAEYYEWYSVINTDNSQFECLALTDYIVFACKWNEECEFVGEPEYVWHTSGDVAPSDNVITVMVGDDVDQSSFFVDVKTTNNDPYIMMAEPSEFVEGMTHEQIYDHLIEDYGTWGLGYYLFEGDVAGRMTGLEPDTEYTLIIFGFKAGKQTTDMQTFTVRTASAGPAEDCTFDFVLNEAGSNSLDITVTPSDAAHFYYWYVYTTDVTADEVKSNIQDMIESSYYGDMYEFSYYELSQGKSTGKISFLAPETEYKVAAVVMDEDTGEFLADVIFSEPFSTGEEDYADITITMSYDKFYDGDDLYDINPDAGAQYKGYAMVPVSITIDGEYSSYYYTIFEYQTGLEDPAVYPDAMLYETLVYYGVYYAEKVNFRAPWNKTVMLAAMAIDKDGRYSRVYRQKCQFKKYDAAPIEELFTKSSSVEPEITVPFRYEEKEIQLEKHRPVVDDRFSQEKMSKVRKENRIRKF